MSNPPAPSTDPVVSLHDTLIEIDLATNRPAKRLSKKQLLALDSRWYSTLAELISTPAVSEEGRRVKAKLFVSSLRQFEDRIDNSLLSEAETIALSLIGDIVGSAEIERLTAMTI